MQMLRQEASLTAIDVHTAEGSFTTATETREEPRGYCFPPIATLITAGARLILAMIAQMVIAAGGQIAYMDADSVAIVCTPEGGLVRCRGRPAPPR
jgi:hypothetical protein